MLKIPKSGLGALLRVRGLAKRQEEFIDVVRQTDERSFIALRSFFQEWLICCCINDEDNLRQKDEIEDLVWRRSKPETDFLLFSQLHLRVLQNTNLIPILPLKFSEEISRKLHRGSNLRTRNIMSCTNG